MKIVIVGCGRFGKEIIKNLVKEKHNIVVIDTNAEDIDTVVNEYDILGYCGNGALLKTLEDAHVSNFDLLIATTSLDEVNLITCMVAKKLGIRKTIARITDTDYDQQIQRMEGVFGIDSYINPNITTSEEIYRLLKFPSAIHVDTFSSGLVEVVELRLDKDSVLNGLKLCEIKSKLSVPVLVCAVSREGNITIPRGDFTLLEGDYIYIMVSSDQMVESFRKIHFFHRRLKNCFIVGGGVSAQFLAKSLLSKGIHVKIFESDQKRCEVLSQLLPEAIIIQSDGNDQKTLDAEGLKDCEALITLTNHDETNIILSAYAKNVGVKKIITQINNGQYDLLSSNLGLETSLSPTHVFASAVIKLVRSQANATVENSLIQNYYQLGSSQIEATEFLIDKATSYTDIPLKKLRLKPQYLLASITRQGEVIIPSGNDFIQVGDSIVIVSKGQTLSDPSDILA